MGLSPEGINTFKTIFNIPSEEMPNVGRLFDEARQDAEGFEPYAAQMGEMFTHNPAVPESLLSGLFEIALADGVVQSSEMYGQSGTRIPFRARHF